MNKCPHAVDAFCLADLCVPAGPCGYRTLDLTTPAQLKLIKERFLDIMEGEVSWDNPEDVDIYVGEDDNVYITVENHDPEHYPPEFLVEQSCGIIFFKKL